MEFLVGFQILAALILVGLTVLGYRKIPVLSGLVLPPLLRWPRLSIVVAARNEGRTLEAALSSMLRVDYPELEVLVVDDRSTDETPEILARMHATNSRLQLKRIEVLPLGWLGKNYALHRGAQASSGDLILFTDADVHYSGDVLKRAVSHLESAGLDHLVALVRIYSHSVFLEGFIRFFGICFMGFMRPWRARDPKAKEFIGVGAFNLVRRSALEAVGGFEKIRLRPDDDIKLGKLLKRAGFRQDCVIETQDIEVEWYESFGQCVVGLEKNVFAGLEYRLFAVGASVALQFLTSILPFVLLVLNPSRPLLWNAPLIECLLFGWVCRKENDSCWYGLLLPIYSACFLGIVIRSTVKNIVDGGIWWRDTFYSLAELKKNRV